MRTPLQGQLVPMSPQGPQCFVDWRWVKAGYVGWYSGDTRIGVWDKAPSNTVSKPHGPFGIRLNAQQAKTIGPIMQRDKPWEYGYHFVYVIYDEGKYRGWYEGIPADHFDNSDVTWPTGHGNVLCYAESDDGFNWHKPKLDIFDYHGDTKTNIVFGRGLNPHGFAVHGSSLFKDPHGPPSERYKLIYQGSSISPNVDQWIAENKKRFGDEMDPMALRHGKGQAKLQLGISGRLEKKTGPNTHWIAGATSPDGLHWTPIPEPLMVHYSDTVNTASWDEQRDRYVGYFRTWRYGRRCIGRAETEDYRLWPSTPDTVLEAPLESHPSDDIYTNAKVTYPNSSDTHLMFPAMYHRLGDSREVYLASSEDSVNWQWVPGGPIIKKGNLGDWDGGDITACPGIVPLSNDRIGVPVDAYIHPHKYPRGGEPNFGSAGWATWQLGRLCAITADEYGEFSTPELVFQGKELSLNLKTLGAGSVKVELRNESGMPIPGHTFTEVDTFAGDNIDWRVSWLGNSDLRKVANQTISVAFKLQKADLFAFEFK